MRTSLLLVLSLAAWSRIGSSSPPPAIQRAATAQIRAELAAVNAEWDAARMAHDSVAFDRMLAPDFWVQIGSTRMTRDEFIEEISEPREGTRLVRFRTEILTLTQEQGAWTAVVREKLEFETHGAGGKPEKTCSLWVTKDRFRKDGDRWRILSSEAVGWENWSGGQTPPFEDWSR